MGRGEFREIWAPDAVVYETTEAVLHLPEILFNVYSGGSVWVSYPVTLEVPCPMKLQKAA